jgi:hypothetical protein
VYFELELAKREGLIYIDVTLYQWRECKFPAFNIDFENVDEAMAFYWTNVSAMIRFDRSIGGLTHHSSA